MKKKIYFFVAMLLMGASGAVAQVAINKTTFPDSLFRTYVAKHIDTDTDKVLSAEEIANVTELQLMNEENIGNCKSLKGVEYFTGLKALDFSNSAVDSIDLSKNTLLESLTCTQTALKALDLSKNTKMTSLDCSESKITKLNITGCREIQNITIDGNQIDSLDVTHCPNLGYIYADDNNLKTLPLTGNPILYYLSVTGNPLDSINLASCPELNTLYCDGTNITKIDVTKNTNLDLLNCTYDALGSIDVSKNTILTQLYLDNCSLTSLALPADTLLSGLSISSNPLGTLDLSMLKNLRTLSCNAIGLRSLDVTPFTNLTTLECANDSLTKLDVSKNTELTRLVCFNNQMVAIDLTACTKINTFDGGINKRAVKVNDAGQFDLATLASFGFDPAKASNWVDGTVDGTILTFDDVNTNATYKYDCGNGKSAIFTLVPKVITSAPLIGGKEVTAYANGNVINIVGTNANAQVIDAAGRTIYAGTDRQITVGSNGLYIVKVAGKTFKVMAR